MRHIAIFACGAVLSAGCMTDDVASAEGSSPVSRYVEVEGKKVHYVDAGSGDEAVVLVHGWSCNQGFWRAQIDGLSQRARILAVDLPGHGQSEKPEPGYSMAVFARAVAAAMDDAGVRRAVLAGHSNGTPVVRQFYRRYPERTAGLVIVDGTLRPLATLERMQQMAAPLNGPDYLAFATAFVDSMLPPSMPAERRAFIRQEMLKTSQDAMAGGFAAAADPAIWKDDKITVPTLVVLAAAPFWTEEYETFAKGLVPDVEWHVREGVSHFLMMDEPAWFNGLVAAFLDKIRFAVAP